MTHAPTPSQRRAIEAQRGPLLVLAGPGAGKTFCLIERIAHLVEREQIPPARICAFTFTNKAAGEIAGRLTTRLGPEADRITRGTIHAFCASLLREFGDAINVERGFGIADDGYQRGVLARIEGPRRWHGSLLTRFSAYRFRSAPLQHDDLVLFEKYRRHLARRNVLDFDQLVLETDRLLADDDRAATVAARYDAVLVDEFQDLNPVQYRVIRALARGHRHIFAVGDHEQSVYSWAGADPAVFRSFVNDFDVASTRVHLEENHRCPRNIFEPAHRLVSINPPIFADPVVPRAERESPWPVTVAAFEDDQAETDWVVQDLGADRAAHGHPWGDVALLYRTHAIGNRLEGALINAGIPCRLAQGRALADDPVVAYVLAALRVIAHPGDPVIRDAFFATVLPAATIDEQRKIAQSKTRDLRRHLNEHVAALPRGNETARLIRRALVDWRNLAALGRQHDSVTTVVQELLSRRVGAIPSVLDERKDELSDPAGLPDVVALAGRLAEARAQQRPIWIPAMRGVDIALEVMLRAVAFPSIIRGGAPPPDAIRLDPDATPSVGMALGLFKALQYLEMSAAALALTDFTAVDLETTDRDIERTEVVEIAAVRVRNGAIAESFASLVRPLGPISAGASDVHGITAADVADAPTFAEVWPRFRAFCGDDVIVAHNGYAFDFRILSRLARDLGQSFELCTYDTLPVARDLFPTSRKLEHLAPMLGIETGRSHRALDDTTALALVVLALDDVKRARDRRTALVNLLDPLAVALALTDEKDLGPEARLFLGFARYFALGRYASCLEAYERIQGEDAVVPGVDEIIDRLGGHALMTRIRTAKSADQRYPATMQRLRQLLVELPPGTLEDQLTVFLERAVLSQDRVEPDRARVNLLTMHSTKGLEFSRVYVVGAEDSQLPGGSPTTGPTEAEVEEARRLLYVGMTRAQERLVLTRSAMRDGKPTGGHRFLDEMGLRPGVPT